MADEAVILELAGQPKGVPLNFTIGEELAVDKGTLMRLSLAAVKTVEASSLINDIFAGVAAEDKEMLSGATTISLWTKGNFEMIADGAITTGAMVSLSGANRVTLAVADDDINGYVVGKALGHAADSAACVVSIGTYN